MKTLIFVVSAAVLLGSGCTAMANRDMSSGQDRAQMKHGQGMNSMMARMDTNGDGMLSKDEFMRAHEAMFDRMKGPNGMISLKDMPAHHGHGMRDHGPTSGKDQSVPAPGGQ